MCLTPHVAVPHMTTPDSRDTTDYHHDCHKMDGKRRRSKNTCTPSLCTPKLIYLCTVVDRLALTFWQWAVLALHHRHVPCRPASRRSCRGWDRFEKFAWWGGWGARGFRQARCRGWTRGRPNAQACVPSSLRSFMMSSPPTSLPSAYSCGYVGQLENFLRP